MLIRSLQEQDRDREFEFIKRLSPESRRARFLGTFLEVPESLLGLLMNVQFPLQMAYVALVPASLLAQGHAHLRWHPVDALPPLPFDHTEIVAQAVARVRSKSQYSSLPVHLCGERFTLPQLKLVYEAVLGERVNQVSFRRRMDELGMLEPMVGETVGGAHRPAQVWRVKEAFRGELSLSERVLAGRE